MKLFLPENKSVIPLLLILLFINPVIGYAEQGKTFLSPQIASASLNCNAEWNVLCEDKKIIAIPEDYQICEYNIAVIKQDGDTEYAVTDSDASSITVYFRAQGNGDRFKKQSAAISLQADIYGEKIGRPCPNKARPDPKTPQQAAAQQESIAQEAAPQKPITQEPKPQETKAQETPPQKTIAEESRTEETPVEQDKANKEGATGKEVVEEKITKEEVTQVVTKKHANTPTEEADEIAQKNLALLKQVQDENAEETVFKSNACTCSPWRIWKDVQKCLAKGVDKNGKSCAVFELEIHCTVTKDECHDIHAESCPQALGMNQDTSLKRLYVEESPVCFKRYYKF